MHKIIVRSFFFLLCSFNISYLYQSKETQNFFNNEKCNFSVFYMKLFKLERKSL